MSGTVAAALPVHRETTAAPSLVQRRAQRLLRGWYSASQLGRVAADGSILDRIFNGYATASVWRGSSSCPDCWRPEVLRMVPAEQRWCSRHGRQTPSVDPFPLEGQELVAAKDRAYAYLGPRRGVPILYQSASFDTSYDTLALAAARRAISDEFATRALVGQGAQGCGKTHSMRCAERELVLDGVENDRADVITFLDFPRLSALLLDREHPARVAETMEACRESDVLFLDDVGSGYTKGSGFVVGCFEEIVCHREQRLYPMVMSTNLGPKEFRTMFGARVYSRLAGSWGCWVVVDGPDLRRRKR